MLPQQILKVYFSSKQINTSNHVFIAICLTSPIYFTPFEVGIYVLHIVKAMLLR